MVTMETNGDLMVKMPNSVGYTADKYLLGLKYVKSSVYYILLKNALTSHFFLFCDPTTQGLDPSIFHTTGIQETQRRQISHCYGSVGVPWIVMLPRAKSL